MYEKTSKLFTFQIIIVRDLNYHLEELPSRPFNWKDTLGVVMQKSTQMVWMAEYNATCLKTLRTMIGPSDDMWSRAKNVLDTSPSVLEMMKSTRELKMTSPVKEVWQGLLYEIQKRNIPLTLQSLQSNGYSGRVKFNYITALGKFYFDVGFKPASK